MLASWYPTQGSPTSGIFFRQQAGLLARAGYDVRVMVPQLAPQGRRAAIRNLLRPELRVDEQTLLQDPEAVFIEVKNGAWKQTVKVRLKAAGMAAGKMNYLLTRAGWTPDIIHAQDMFDAGLVAHEYRRRYGVPYVLTQHNPLRVEDSYLDFYQQIRTVVKEAQRFSVVSGSEYMNWVRNGLAESGQVLGNYINEQVFRPAVNGSGRKEPVRLLYVSATSWIKDNASFVEVLRLLQEEYSVPFRATLLLATRYSDREGMDDIRRYISESGVRTLELRQNVDSQEEMARLYNEHDIYISTSIYETFGVSVAESISCGCFAVVSANGGCSDIIKEGVNGTVVPFRSPRKMAQAIANAAAAPASDRQLLHETIASRYGSVPYMQQLKLLYSFQ